MISNICRNRGGERSSSTGMVGADQRDAVFLQSEPTTDTSKGKASRTMQSTGQRDAVSFHWRGIVDRTAYAERDAGRWKVEGRIKIQTFRKKGQCHDKT